uniref:COMM domain-containing protein 6 n=1 Tax=Ornithorhynchus anatinus TaxID=9258 RepID=A0A6I8PND6_ORNAN
MTERQPLQSSALPTELSKAPGTGYMYMHMLIDIQWKLGMAVSSDSCRSLKYPYVSVTLKVADQSGQIVNKSFEMTVPQFQVCNSNIGFSVSCRTMLLSRLEQTGRKRGMPSPPSPPSTPPLLPRAHVHLCVAAVQSGEREEVIVDLLGLPSLGREARQEAGSFCPV